MTLTRSAPTFRWRALLLPTLSQWLGLLILLVVSSAAWRTTMVASDGDSWMHWRVGEWMLQHRQIVSVDEFSHTRFGATVVSKEWLAELIYAGAGRWAGLYGLVFVAGLVIATTFALLHRQLLLEGMDLMVASLVTLLAAWAACSHWLARPHVFSFLMMFLWNTALRRHERDHNTGRLTGVLAGLTMLWVNLHGAFLAGFFVLGAYWLGALVERNREKLRSLTIAGTVCAIASLANPSGYRLHLHNVSFLRSEYLTNWLAEYSSTDFHSAGALGFMVWLAAIFFTLVIVRPRLTASEGFLLILWTYFALYASRNIPLLAIVSAPVLAGALSGWVPVRWREFSQRAMSLNQAGQGWLFVVVAVVAIGALPHPIEIPADRWPVEAVQFIRKHPEQFTGKMFNQYMWGGYLLEALPEHKTFVDGRTDFFGESLIREFAQVTALGPDWREPLRKYDVSWVLMPSTHRLNVALAQLPGEWSCVHSDVVATIWRKNE